MISRNYRLYRNGNSAKNFSYAVMANGIPVGDQYASSTHAVLQTGLNNQIDEAALNDENRQK